MGGDVAGNIDSWIAAVQNTNSHALLLVIISIAIGFLWPARLAKFLPATFVVLLVGTVLGVVWLRDAPVVGAVPSGWPEIQMPVFSAGLLIRVLEPAFVMALMNTISSLMLSLVIDPITGVGHKPNQQTISIGLGNIIASLFGGMVGAGSYATLNNLRSGGRSPLSGVLAASALVAAAFGLGPMLGRIPLAVLAGIIIKVGWDLIDWRFIARLHLISRGYVLVRAPNRCCHRTNPTGSASSLTTTAWWPMPACSCRPPSPGTWACGNSSTVTLTSAMRRGGRTRGTRC